MIPLFPSTPRPAFDISFVGLDTLPSFVTCASPTLDASGLYVAVNNGRATISTSSVPGFSASQGTILVEYDKDNIATDDNNVFGLNDDTGSEAISIITESSKVRFAIFDGGSGQVSIFSGTKSSGTRIRAAFAWMANDFAAVADGVLAGTDSSGTLPTVTTFQIGGYRSGSPSPIVGHIRRIAYWRWRLPSETMIAATSNG